MKKIRVLTLFGTRPEAIKLAPVIHALERRSDRFESRVLVTGQHRQMLDQVLEIFGIRPHHDLNIMSHGQTLFEITRRALSGLEELIPAENPDIILVEGDTTTVFVAALAGFYHRIPVGHVEAGLRTDNRFHPYPEEMNRVLTSHLADYHFAPTGRARKNLLAEGIPDERITVTGNTVVDALLSVVRPDYEFECEDLRRADRPEARWVTVTTHRRESWGHAMEESLSAIRDVVADRKDLVAIFPVHYSPAVRESVSRVLEGAERFVLIPPLPYLDFVHLLRRSTLIFTDSGGVQEEAPTFGVPVLVLRETTERPEGIEAGVAKLVGTSRQRIMEEAEKLLDDPDEHRKMSSACKPYGDGRAAERIADALKTWL